MHIALHIIVIHIPVKFSWYIFLIHKISAIIKAGSIKFYI